ncbi:copper resistance system multicopper oxidase [Sulfurovum sp. NBC37-1]|uniref:copper resistance system multicopper oxidase n=1 Tax=Sulfurovum sp. (strain NBC37-1) TaxID=387093 RepID=UPI0001587484|nr:copper resistance system multicopper oxidase [Sulfurovum sp. NBC37-1]BAF71759.1 copper resistance protein A [Sulfurovum sp. NBC37-1]
MQRRTFIKGVAASSFMGIAATDLQAESPKRSSDKRRTLTGKEFFLDIDYTPVNITGKRSVATTINGQIPGPTLVWQEGDTVTIHVTNHLKKSSSIHWHGIILPYQMDGVPGISYKGIAPGETFTYRFKVRQHGTYWYHSHSGYQEQTGMYGAIVIKPRKREPFRYDKDYVVLLSDWSDEKPTSIYRKLKLSSDYYNFNRRTVGDFFSEVKKKGFGKAFDDRKMWNQMRMSDRDLSDVTGYTYTYLMNGQNPATQFKALFKKGEKIRLRFINGAAMSFFDVRIPGLKMTVVAADGNHIKPVRVDEFRIGVAETYDVIVEPTSNRAYAIFAQSIERSGYALGSLTPSASKLASAPKMDKPQALTMADMGMGMSKMGKDKGMKMPMKKSMKKYRWSAMEAEKYPITKLPIATGPQSTMKAMAPKYRLEDPGVGLRNNGRRVLTYADMKNRYSTRRAKKPDREIVLHLTGNMERYMWSINGIKYADAKPLVFHYGERLRITFINDTMMNHPMHLHGMWSDLETGDDNHLVRKHTIVVQPGAKISYRVTVDAKGGWAYHCHLLYHMAGMFRKVEVV